MVVRWNRVGYTVGVEHVLPLVKPRSRGGPTSLDRDEFMAMVDAHGPALAATLRRLCQSQHDADDLFQETAIRVWRNFGSRPVLRSPRAWLITIGYRAFLDLRGGRAGRSSGPLAECVDEQVRSPQEQMEAAEAAARLNEHVDRLPDQLREVIVLHYQGGLSIRQTAAAIGISVAITKNRLHAALKQLRSAFE